jgi:hypothetical protein
MRFSAIVLVAALVTVVPAAAAQQRACAKRGDVVDYLAGKYRESPVAIGLANSGGVIEVLASPSGGGFTIIITMPNGVSCLIAAGENWQNLPATPKRGPGA